MEKPRLKLDFQKTFLIGFGFFGTSVMWKLYNDYVPIFLQAGNPLFESTTKTSGFGLGPGLTGFIMTLDNIVALFLLPLIGLWSDRIWAPKLGGASQAFHRHSRADFDHCLYPYPFRRAPDSAGT